VDLRDFESILIFFSEEEIAELQAAIEARCKVRAHLSDTAAAACEVEPHASETGYSPKCLEEGSPKSISETG
jgi:hypothetical protein